MKRYVKRYLPFLIGTPAMVWQCLFFYVPILLMVLSSVIKYSALGEFEGVTFSNFTPLFNWVYASIIFKTLLLALFSAIASIACSLPLAHFIAFKAGKKKHLMLFLLILPFWTNFLLHVYAWFFVLEREGFVNTLLMNLHLIQEPIHFLNSLFAITLMMVYYFLPFSVLPIFSALERFDRRLFDASSDLGASKIQTFKRVLLPVIMPAIRTGFFLVFIPAFGEFIIPELMGGDKFYFAGNVISQFVMGDATESVGYAFTIISIFTLLITSALVLLGFNKISKWLVGRAR